ncbi:porin family protein [Flavobacterium ponti]|uniref:Porin family protein n=1 Tax=Flavobacterium ponti TaxID=665133 RepID=A0ABV9P3Q5_9FLAO
MKKAIFITLVFLASNLIKAQNISYGPVIGYALYEIGNNNGRYHFVTDKNKTVNFGAYLEYQFTDNLGLKTELIFNKKEAYYESSSFTFPQDKFNFSFVEINPNLKYDFGQEYRKGFYMLLGPKISFLTKITLENEDVKDDFETFIYGGQLGFGYRIFKFIDLQTKIEYDIAPFIKFDNDRKSQFFGANISLNLDLEQLINSN